MSYSGSHFSFARQQLFGGNVSTKNEPQSQGKLAWPNFPCDRGSFFRSNSTIHHRQSEGKLVQVKVVTFQSNQIAHVHSDLFFFGRVLPWFRMKSALFLLSAFLLM